MRSPLVRAAVLAGCFLLVVVGLWAQPSDEAAADPAPPGEIQPVDLRCDGLIDPLGVDSSPPRLSWGLSGEVRSQRQTAYQVLAARSPSLLTPGSADLWDSGRISSSQQHYVAYAGVPLESARRSYWKVRVWDARGRPSEWSPVSSWTTGPLQADWPGRWITHPELLPHPGGKQAHRHADAASVLLKREFTLGDGVTRALLFVSGLGHADILVNGRLVGTELLAPGWTNTARTVLYVTHDVTPLLKTGPNALALCLAGGFHALGEPRGARPAPGLPSVVARVQLRLEYADGTVQTIASDGSWQAAFGPTRVAHPYAGEDYDARLSQAGWDQAGVALSGSTPAAETDGPAGILRGASFASAGIRRHETLEPVSVRPLRRGVWVYDFGQNTSILPTLHVSGGAGARVKLIPAELLKADGAVDRVSCSRPGMEAAWSYTLAGSGKIEEWSPRFFLHGARYLQAELSAGRDGRLPRIEGLDVAVVHAEAAALGEFSSSNETLNRVRQLVRWAQRSNLAHVLTENPHRDRRNSLSQYHLSGPSLRYEFGIDQLAAKAFRDMDEAQLPSGQIPPMAPEGSADDEAVRHFPEAGSALVLGPWQHFVWTGDDLPLRRHYGAMKRFVAYLETRADEGLLAEGAGDGGELASAGATPPGLVASALYFDCVRTLAKIARQLGATADAASYDALAIAVRDAFTRKYFNNAVGSYASGSQTSLAMPLALGMVGAGFEEPVLQQLVHAIRTQGAITARKVGHPYVLRALTDAGRSDLVFQVHTQSEKPGYVYQLGRGATSLNEAWDGAPTLSQNHIGLGQITEWLYADLAGLAPDPTEPGFQRVLFRPQPVEGVEWVRSSHQSPRGRVAISWRRTAERFILRAEVPPNSTGEVWIPTTRPREVEESGEPAHQRAGVRLLRVGESYAVFSIDSGVYDFVAPR